MRRSAQTSLLHLRILLQCQRSQSSPAQWVHARLISVPLLSAQAQAEAQGLCCCVVPCAAVRLYIQGDPFSFSDDEEDDGTSFGYKFRIHIKAKEASGGPGSIGAPVVRVALFGQLAGRTECGVSCLGAEHLGTGGKGLRL